jgi:opacity protein-like surface antigen
MKGRLIVGALGAVLMLATAVAVQAADMGLPVYKAAPPPLLTTNWSGFYFGGHAGAAWGSTNDDFNDPTALAPFRWDSGIPVSGPLAGGQIGYNWQSGWMLFGLEADGSWSNITGHGLCNTTTFFMNCSSKVEGLATVTGRIGASIDRALIYFKGGGAWGRESETISNVALVLEQSLREPLRLDHWHGHRICLPAELVGQDRIRFHRFRNEALQLPGDQYRGRADKLCRLGLHVDDSRDEDGRELSLLISAAPERLGWSIHPGAAPAPQGAGAFFSGVVSSA